MITEDIVKHMASLARLKLTSVEVKKFSSQLDSVFDYMKILNEVDTDKVLPTSQVTGLKNVTRSDSVSAEIDPEKLLKCSEMSLERNQIRVKPIFE